MEKAAATAASSSAPIGIGREGVYGLCHLVAAERKECSIRG